MSNNEYSDFDIQAMQKAIDMSSTSLNDKEIPQGGPFGAVIYKDGKMIAASYNHVLAENDPSAHAEVHTIRAACKTLGTWDLEGCVLYTSCEPCPMCLMTSKWANINKIYFAADRKDAQNTGFKDNDLYEMMKIGNYGIQIKECHSSAVEVMQKWQQKFGVKGQY